MASSVTNSQRQRARVKKSETRGSVSQGASQDFHVLTHGGLENFTDSKIKRAVKKYNEFMVWNTNPSIINCITQTINSLSYLLYNIASNKSILRQ